MMRFLLLFLTVFLLSAAENALKIRIPNEEFGPVPNIEAEKNIRSEDRLQPLPKGKERTLSTAYPDQKYLIFDPGVYRFCKNIIQKYITDSDIIHLCFTKIAEYRRCHFIAILKSFSVVFC